MRGARCPAEPMADAETNARQWKDPVSDQSPMVTPLPDYALRTSSVTPAAAAGCAGCGQPAVSPAGSAFAGSPPPPAVTTAAASAGFAYGVGRLSARFP